MTRLPGPLVALTPGVLRTEAEVQALLRSARGLVSLGLDSILLREPGLNERLFTQLGRGLGDLRLPEGAPWIGVHDRLHQALVLESPGVHLGFKSLSVAEARRILPPAVRVGFSAHAGDQLERIGADYYFYSPVLETPSKQGLLEPVGFEGLAEACASTAAPVYGLGGMRAEHLPAARGAGARGIAVLSGIFGQTDPEAALQGFLNAVESEGR